LHGGGNSGVDNFVRESACGSFKSFVRLDRGRASRSDYGTVGQRHEAREPGARHGPFLFHLFPDPDTRAAIAGWLYDLTADAFWPVLFAMALFFATALANLAFRFAQKRLPL